MSLLAVTHLASASAWAVYAVGALMALAGAAGVVLQRNPVHCALVLVTTIFGIALLFIDQGADFLAAVQIIVYAGAIVILFLFVIMLLGVDRKETRNQDRLKSLTPVAILVGVVALAELLVLVRVHYWATGTKAAAGAAQRAGRERPEARSEYLHGLPSTVRNDLGLAGHRRGRRRRAGPPGGTGARDRAQSPAPQDKARPGPAPGRRTGS